MAKAVVDFGAVARKSLTIQIVFERVRTFSLRLKLALVVIRIAGFISPIPFSIDAKNETRT